MLAHKANMVEKWLFYICDFDTKAKGKMMQPMNVFLQVILHQKKNQQKKRKACGFRFIRELLLNQLDSVPQAFLDVLP